MVSAHLMDSGAANCLLDQLSTTAIDDRSHNIPFGFPNEGVVNLDRFANGRTEEVAEMVQDQWMSGAGVPGAYELSRNR